MSSTHDHDTTSEFLLAASPDDTGNATRESAPSLKTGRRSFIGSAGKLALGGMVAGSAVSAFGARGEPDDVVDSLNDLHAEPGASPYAGLRRLGFETRERAAKIDYRVAIAQHPHNGDEQRYANKIGTDTRGLPHNERGEVDLAAYASALQAFTSQKWTDFEKIRLGGTRKLVNPYGTLASNLTDLSPVQYGIPPAPALASAQRGAEAVELYWNALLRDVPFSEYATHRDVAYAAAELDKLSGYTGPREAGRVAPGSLFRGSVTYADPQDASGRTAKHVIPPGVSDGPYISQLILRDIPYGAQYIPALNRVPLAGQDFLTVHQEWLAIQNGQAPTQAIRFDSQRRRLINGRDLAEYVHTGSPLFWGAALLLGAARSNDPTVPGGVGAPLNPSNPYLASKTQAGANGSFGLGYFQGLLALGISHVIRAAYWQKWFVHRTLRPEAYGGLVHQRLANHVEYPLHQDLLESQALALSYGKFGSYLLPHAFPEGAPNHGSYPGGAAAIAGVAATLLKAVFDESFIIQDPVTVDPTDPTRLIPYTGIPLTVGGELNKLAANYGIGRSWAGIHWRTDAGASLALGEQVAISILRNERLTLREPFGGFVLTRFDGTRVTI